ncbi:uncharacterized protein [Dermacentor albipictus]|uniref:uncharacterized protein isoform X1 n=1 Tax=Dermacentor albipictus TaxID=60249 RepID=UPI0038FC5CC9
MDFQDILEDRHDDPATMEEDLSQGTPSECPYFNWSLHLKRRTKKKLARGEQVCVAGRVISPLSPSSATALSSSSYAAAGAGASKKASFKKRRRLPPLPRSDFKIIIRPKKGLQVKSFSNHQISKAVSAACGGKVDDSHFIVRLRPGSNIIIVSTPDQEVADIARKITRIVLGGNLYEVNSYVAAPDGVARGVIHGIDPDTPPEELMTHLRVRTQGVEIVQARMLGKTKTALITFNSHVVPRYVYYYGGETECHTYKPTKQICYVCQRMGHRSDVCPTPNIKICLACGTHDPTDGHECSLKCAVCGEAHATGSRECKQKLKNKSTTTKKHPPPGRRKEDDDNDGRRPRRSRLRWSSSESSASRSRSRAQSRSMSRSRSRSRSQSRSRSRFRSEWPKLGEKQGQRQPSTSTSTSKQKNQANNNKVEDVSFRRLLAEAALCLLSPELVTRPRRFASALKGNVHQLPWLWPG